MGVRYPTEHSMNCNASLYRSCLANCCHQYLFVCLFVFFVRFAASVGLTRLEGVPVQHSYPTTAVRIDGAAGWSFAFSGDCLPHYAPLIEVCAWNDSHEAVAGWVGRGSFPHWQRADG